MIAYIRKRIERIPPPYRPGAPFVIAAAVCCAAAYGFVGWLFFELWLVSALSAAAGGWAVIGQMEAYAARKKRLTASQFEQLLFALATSLQAGKSVENAFREAEDDLERLYGGGKSVLMTELKKLNRMSEHGIALEKSVREFQRALAIGEIDDWADMFCTCRRTGGDLVKVMRQTSRGIVEKMNMERELGVLIAGKRFEARALAVVPFLIVGVFRYGSPEYMEMLYAGQGRLVMIAALCLLGIGIYATGRIMRIEV